MTASELSSRENFKMLLESEPHDDAFYPNVQPSMYCKRDSPTLLQHRLRHIAGGTQNSVSQKELLDTSAGQTLLVAKVGWRHPKSLLRIVFANSDEPKDRSGMEIFMPIGRVSRISASPTC